LAITIILHISNEDPILAEIEALPEATDTTVTILNPRRKDGKAVAYLANGVRSVTFPWWRVSFLEVMSSDSEQREIIGFYRESK